MRRRRRFGANQPVQGLEPFAQAGCVHAVARAERLGSLGQSRERLIEIALVEHVLVAGCEMIVQRGRARRGIGERRVHGGSLYRQCAEAGKTGAGSRSREAEERPARGRRQTENAGVDLVFGRQNGEPPRSSSALASRENHMKILSVTTLPLGLAALLATCLVLGGSSRAAAPQTPPRSPHELEVAEDTSLAVNAFWDRFTDSTYRLHEETRCAELFRTLRPAQESHAYGGKDFQALLPK